MGVRFDERVLGNGLRIIAEVDPDAHSSAVGFFVRTGARDEAPAVMGVSHFLEHMMFKGTEDLSAEDLNQRFDAMGARNNAFTSAEMTCFYAHVLPERLGEAADLIGRMMRPALRDADFTTEKSVILEEIKMYKDEPFWVLYERLMEAHFGPHPMGHRVLGTDATISALSRDQMAAYFDARYSADTTVVALAGKMDLDAIADVVERRCAAWRPTRVGRDSARPRVGGGEFVERDAKVKRAYLMGLADAPAIQDPRRYAATLLAQVLGAPDNSRLHWALVETGLAEEAHASYDAHDGTGEFQVLAIGDPERADEIWSAVLREIDGLVASLTDDDLARLRSKLATSVTVGGERPADRMQRLGRLWTYLGRYTTLEEELERINRVTLDDLREVAREFPLRPVTAGRLIPA
ncbi:MAG: insulinase family protein [Phycisphaerae bacterium]|nr:insulinase family protein [Phycisphaerae bacterium]